jgi:hypothetical protein
MEILQFRIEEYAIAFDMVQQLESLGLVKSRHPNDVIIVELTDEGWNITKKDRGYFSLSWRWLNYQPPP